MLSSQKQQLNKEISSNILFSLILKRITTLLMKQGKRTQAEKILENILLKISLKGYSPRKIFVLAINNVKPLIEVRNIRVKGKSFQVPIPLSKARQFSLAIKTILKNSSGKKNIENAVVDELINSSLNKSLSVKTTIGMYKLAARNRLFAHYRWF
jgi:small subunit ribosomal protein S7